MTYSDEQTARLRGLVAIDAAIHNFVALEGEIGAGFRSVILSNDTHPLDALAKSLEAMPGQIEELHIVAHASPGSVRLGDLVLDAQSVPRHIELLSRIGRAMADDGVIALTGCEVAAQDSGAAFLQELAEVTGVEVVGTRARVGGYDANSFTLNGDLASPFTHSARVAYGAHLAAPTGALVLNGIPKEGETLTAASTLMDADGLGTLSYEWLRDGVVIGGATGGTYNLVLADVGTQLSVRATYTDGSSAVEMVTSAESAPVINSATVIPVSSAEVFAGDFFTGRAIDLSEAGGGKDFLVGGTASQSSDQSSRFNYTNQQTPSAGKSSFRGQDLDSQDPADGTVSSITVDTNGGNTTRLGIQFFGNTQTLETMQNATWNFYQNYIFNGDDEMVGSYEADHLVGYAGNDILIGGYGDKTEYPASDGSYQGSKNTLDNPGERADPQYWIDDGADTLDGKDGNDTLDGGTGDDILIGGLDDDLIYGGSGNDTAVINANSGSVSVIAVTDGIEVTSADGVDVYHNDVESFQFNNTTLTFAQTLAIGQASNAAPTGIQLTSASTDIDENTDTTTRVKVADIAVTDDGLGTNVLALIGADAAMFEIDGTELFISAGTTLDHEDQAQLDVFVTVDDSTIGSTPDATVAFSIAVNNVNEAPTGRAFLSGEAVVGATLTALDAIEDPDGLGAMSYQWQRDGVNIGGASSNTYVLAQADVGTQVSFIASYTDGGGFSEMVASAATATVGTTASPENAVSVFAGDYFTGRAIDLSRAGGGEDFLVGGPASQGSNQGNQFHFTPEGGGRANFQGTGFNNPATGVADRVIVDPDGGNTSRFGIESFSQTLETMQAANWNFYQNNIFNGDDTMTGSYESDNLVGYAGDDILIGGYGDKTEFPADDGSYQGVKNTLTNPGQRADQQYWIDDGDDTLDGEAGNDTLDGGTGNDLLIGGTGNDLIYGGSGTNAIFGGFGNDTVQGGVDGDVIYGGGTGTNALLGNDGNDVIFTGAGGDFVGGGAGNDFIRGGGGADTIYGGAGSNNVAGGGGNDQLFMAGGNDTVYGGAGNDFVGGGAGNDLIIDGAGNNTLYGGFGSDTVQGGAGSDSIYGGGQGPNQLLGFGGNDLIVGGAGADFIGGGAGDDSLYGSQGTDTIYAGLGNDFVGAGTGNDVVYGGAGNNRVYLGTGNDRFVAGTGNDVVTGGSGVDTFVFNSAAQIGIGASRDVITDFTSGDKVDLSALNTQFNGTLGLSGGGTSSFYNFSGGGLLIGDDDGNGTVDWVLELSGYTTASASDFIL